MITALAFVLCYLLNIAAGIIIGLNLCGWKPKKMSSATWEHFCYLSSVFIIVYLFTYLFS